VGLIYLHKYSFKTDSIRYTRSSKDLCRASTDSMCRGVTANYVQNLAAARLSARCKADESSGACFETCSLRHALSIFHVENVEISRTLFNDSRAIQSKMHMTALFRSTVQEQTGFGLIKTTSKTYCNHEYIS